MTRKILYIVSNLRRTGPVSQLWNIVSHLPSSDFAPSILTLSPEPQDSFWPRFVAAGIDVQTLGLSRLQGLFKARAQVRKFLDHNPVDILHTQGVRADTLVARLTDGPKRMATLRCLPQSDYPYLYGAIAGRLMASQHFWALSQLDHVVGVSDEVTENMLRYSRPRQSSTIANGVDTDRFAPVDHATKLRLRNDAAIPPDAKLWLVVGDLIGRKNPRFVAEAFQKFQRNFPDDHLVFLGDGPQRAALHPFVSDTIRMVGAVTAPEQYMQMADYVISASQAEGLPNAILEAMACGCPAVLSDIAPHAQLLNTDGLGELFTLGNKSACIAAMATLRAKERSMMAQTIRSHMMTHYSAKGMSAAYQSLYRMMAEGAE